MKFLTATPAFAVSDLKRSIEFYCGQCGYSEIARGPGFALLQRGGVALHLWLADDSSWKDRDGTEPVVSGAESFLSGTVSCRIEVTGISELYDQMEPLGVVHPRAPLKRAGYPAREFAILDPDGNLITFFEMDSPTG